ncbi:MAG: CpaF family protein [Coriobacteriia bacterium]|nr:CpaF family protein [Coriobacteriia bacterium]
MSLSERARKAGAVAVPGHLVLGQEDLRMGAELRQQVQELVPVDQIARLVAENPERARNELRRACDQVMDAGSWVMVPAERKRLLIQAFIDEVFGYGPIEDLLDDPTVTEVMVNGPSRIFFERDGMLYAYERAFQDEAQLRALIDRILGPLGRRIDEASPMVNTRLPQGHRVNAIIPPLSLVGPVLTIRKFTERVLTLDQMTEQGSMDEAVRQLLVWMVRLRKNVAVSGGTGSGKTTLLNALSCQISADERIVTIEDSAELRFLEHPHVVRLEARPASAEGTGQVTIRDLVINALRMRPDRIVVGECRGAEALDMLQAMNTGHDGSLTTLHANAPQEVVTRLSTMVRYAVDLPVDVVEANIASAIDVVVQTARARDGRRYVSQISELEFDRGRRRCECRTLYARDLLRDESRWERMPAWIDDVADWGVAAREEVESWKRTAKCC